jgi:hypothetical protein
MSYPEYRPRWYARAGRVLAWLVAVLSGCVIASVLFVGLTYGLYLLVKAVTS